MSQIPTSTGAAKAVGLVLPELKGKLDGVAIRVPTPNVSLVDLTFVPPRETTVDELKQAIRAAADGPLKGVLAYTTSRWSRSTSTATRPARPSTWAADKVLEGKLARVASWYDNEWGFSCRMLDTAAAMTALG